MVGTAQGSQTQDPAFWGPHPTNGHVCATVEETKRRATEEFFIPYNTKSYVPSVPRAYTEFRYDSCNTEQGQRDSLPEAESLGIDDL
jgi:hypothetical protein